MRDAATLFMVGGFVLAVIGIGMLSVPAALVMAGVTLFVSGGLEHRAQKGQTATPSQSRASRMGG